MLLLHAVCSAAQVLEIKYMSTTDKVMKTALLQLPVQAEPARKLPLLVWTQGMYRNAHWAIENWGAQVERKGWYLLAIDQQGERTGLKPDPRPPLAGQKDWDYGATCLGA